MTQPSKTQLKSHFTSLPTIRGHFKNTAECEKCLSSISVTEGDK